MNDFAFFFQLGMEHILSWDALDHLLFVAVLSCVFTYKNLRQLLILVTAFTIGHSITLALSVLNVVTISSSLVEVLIPFTIVLTAAQNLFLRSRKTSNISLQYLLALLFGLIHGLGFANTIRFMLSKHQQIAMPLFSFNVGLEVGQIIVVALLLALNFLVLKLGLPQKAWTIFFSVVGICVGIWMMYERLRG